MSLRLSTIDILVLGSTAGLFSTVQIILLQHVCTPELKAILRFQATSVAPKL